MEEKISFLVLRHVYMRKDRGGEELRKTSLPVLLYGGVSNTHYLFNGKVKKVMEKKRRKVKEANGFFGILLLAF
jgi:hypothetical protein